MFYLSSRRRLLTVAGTLALTAGIGLPVTAAADYPERPITLVVPYAPAGPTDILARLAANQLSKELNQTVIVENRPGASGAVGLQSVARAPADGYTLVIGGLPAQILNPALRDNLAYDAEKDFKTVAILAHVPYILVTRPDLPGKSLPEFIDYLSNSKGELNYGSPGVGNTSQVTAEMFKSAIGVDMTHVPYKGDAPAIQDLMGGSLDLVFTLPVGVLQLVEAGRLTAVGTAAPQRSPVLPDLPTFAEQDLKGVEAQTWFSVLAPSDTPDAIVKTLNEAINTAVQRPDVREKMASLGAVPASGTPQEVEAFVAQEHEKWTPLIPQSAKSQ